MTNDVGPCVIGLDVGTQGARAVAVTAQGHVLASASEPFRDAVIELPKPLVEQRPEAWWEAAALCLRRVMSDVGGVEVRALAVDSTSGTFVPVDAAGRPLRPALMYNDGRAGPGLADEVQQAGQELASRLGYRFPPAFALPKMLWLKREEPEVFDRAARLIHATDYLVGRLTGRFDVTDTSTALKSGVDLETGAWPSFIGDALGIPRDKLPDVVSPGDPIGPVWDPACRETGLRPETTVVGGSTDGTACFLASGASAPGQWNSTLGTTLVLRGVSERIVHDPAGRYYCHRHPEGYWLPGGASNVGGECLAVRFAGRDLAELDRAAAACLPTGLVVYPLVRRGERAPFECPAAEGFVLGGACSEAEGFAAHLEGVALVERWCFDTLAELGAVAGDTIRATGGGSRSDVWLQVRADVLQRCLERPTVSDGAMGSALLAASRTLFDGLTGAARAMVRIAKRVEPDPAGAACYADKLRRLRERCRELGYL